MLAFLMQSWVGQLFMAGINWWNKRQAAREAAKQQMDDDLQAHAGDGKASVDIRNSYQQQLDELERISNQPKESENVSSPSSPSKDDTGSSRPNSPS